MAPFRAIIIVITSMVLVWIINIVQPVFAAARLQTTQQFAIFEATTFILTTLSLLQKVHAKYLGIMIYPVLQQTSSIKKQ